jgi:hypothetical protein
MYNEIKSIKEPNEEDCYLGIIRVYQREVDSLQEILKNIDDYIEYKLWNYINERAEYLKCRDELYNIYKDVYKSKYKENKIGD